MATPADALATDLYNAPYALVGSEEARLFFQWCATWGTRTSGSRVTVARLLADRLEEDAFAHAACGDEAKAATIRGLADRVAALPL